MQLSVSPIALRHFARACFSAVGVVHDDADWAATAMVEADLQGLSTHGTMRLKAYIEGLQSGKINARPHMTWNRTGPVTAILNGDNGLGCVSAKLAANFAVDLARTAGLGAVAVYRGNHAGALSLYAEWATHYGMIGLCCCNTHPAVPPTGGRKPFFGTNPIAFAAPTNAEYSLSIDLATSVVARGHIIQAARRGEAIPEGWAVDREGRATIDPKAALDGSLLPMAGAKGYALAMMIEVLAGVLSGARVGDEVGSMFGEGDEPPGNGFFYLAINPEHFVGQAAFVERIQTLMDDVHAVPLAEGSERIYVPGERRFLSKQLRRATGIPISEEVWDDFSALAQALGVHLPECTQAR
ncbi:lactate dehydrogenase [Alicyclobacillus hesperidum]|uniref:Lactate dehydrogenase n=1 Tax=Alicyclobacillus hesperidum TaxID=89784 RepID=A0AA37X4E7_9BACL|nr:Ldh family oxidoreductase [Alicyclobacillus hesperidum]GLV14872.1 lactate dehydrogenase [Alicyclobacillus hesperidum]